MVYVPKRPPEKAEVLDAVRAAVAAAGGRRITRSQFLKESGMRECDTVRYHAGWNEVLRAAGCEEDQPNRLMRPELLLADFGAVTRKLGRAPSCNEYRVHGKYTWGTLFTHFGSWTRVPDAFRTFAARRSAWRDVMALMPPPRQARKTARNLKRKRLAPRIYNRPVCGAPLGTGGLRCAPTNESGVVFLFGVMAERLGFEVEGFQASFPDCEAKRRVGPEAWQNVKIEFEYESRNFRDHGHAAEGCDPARNDE